MSDAPLQILIDGETKEVSQDSLRGYVTVRVGDEDISSSSMDNLVNLLRWNEHDVTRLDEEDNGKIYIYSACAGEDTFGYYPTGSAASLHVEKLRKPFPYTWHLTVDELTMEEFRERKASGQLKLGD